MMNLRKILHLSLAVLSVCFFVLAEAAEKPGNGKTNTQSLGKVSGTPTHQILNINNITTWARSDGESNHTPSGVDGVQYPVGTGTIVYEDGIVFGSKQFLDAARTQTSQSQKIRVGGSTYLSNVGTKAGYVTGVGAAARAASPDAADVRYYRVRRDYYFMTDGELGFDAMTRYEHSKISEATQSEKDAVKAQYDTDWKNWPVDKGAPYIERNGKPGYQAPPAFGPSFTVDSLIAGNYDEPGIGDPTTPADQLMWTAYNDIDKAQSLRFEGSEPQGLEIQVSTWGYKRSDAMGNCYFKRVKLTNKGGVDLGNGTVGAFYLDSMYVCQWSDIDLGQATDDLAGCDSARSLGYVYNGNATDQVYARYGLPPPASGYDFLAGPVVAGAATDSAVVDMKRVFGKKNLPMSGFSYFSAGSPYSDPPFGDYNTGTGRWWNMLRGYAPLGTITDPPVLYNAPPGHWPTKYPLQGDPSKPAAANNFIDGQGTLYSFVQGDRRVLLCTGPFTLNPGESQELYVGYVAAIGADRISSISVLKANDNAVQETFNLLFKVAKAPQNPVVKVTEMDGSVILDWANNAGAVAATEKKIADPGHYTFQGYNVYQFPSAGATLDQAKRLGTYDIVDNNKVILNEQFDLASGAFLKVPIQFGSDAGVKRNFLFNQDWITGNNKLWNGQEYYLAVTAYSITSVAGYVAALESSPNILTVVPKVPFGKSFSLKAGDTLKATKSGISDGNVVPLVINPAALTGNTYEVSFDDTKDPVEWKVVNKTTGVTKLSGQTNQSGDDDYLFVDGVMVKVLGPPPGMKEYSIPAGSRRFTWAGADWGLEGFNGAIGMAYNHWFSSSSVTPDKLHSVVLKLGTAAAPWDAKNPPNDPNYSFGYRYLRRASSAPASPSFAPFIVNPTAGYAYQDFNKSVPFSAWDIDVNPPVRLAVGLHENNVVGGFVDGVYFPGSSDNTDNTVSREFAFVFSKPYTTTVDADLAKDALNNTLPIMWWLAVNRRGSNTFFTGDEFQITGNKVNTSAVKYTFSAPAPLAGPELESASATKIGVFPNPYYAANLAETSRFDRFVTFNNLPKNAVIRIFNLAGQLVRTLEKSSDNQFLRWDLMNQRNYPVASGLYIAYVELPDLGFTKTLKFSIIQQQEFLDYF
jgi:hypothetical protein